METVSMEKICELLPELAEVWGDKLTVLLGTPACRSLAGTVVTAG